MTTELEQEFFNVFEIEKNNDNCPMLDKSNCIFVPSECNYYHYPEITGDMLLQLIVIRATNYKNGTVIELEPDSNIKDLKYEVLTHFINYRGSFDKHQIQQLFKEGE